MPERAETKKKYIEKEDDYDLPITERTMETH